MMALSKTKERNIVLVGFMATGKTSLGLFLSKKLGKKLFNTDDLIEKKSKKTISYIFKQDGEIHFRELEIQAVKKASRMNGVIIDCGGGVVLNKINIDRLRENGVIFLLTAKPEKILERENRQKGARPLLLKKDKIRAIKELLSFRKPFYQMAYDYTIDTTNLSIEEVGKKIIKIYNAAKHFRRKF